MRGSKDWNKRVKNKDIKVIVVEGKELWIDNEMIENEDNMAEKQCEDKFAAFQDHKDNKLFPNKFIPKKRIVEKIQNKNIITAYKLMAKELADRNSIIKN